VAENEIVQVTEYYCYQIKSNLFAISSVHNITIDEFALRLAGQTGDNFALMPAHEKIWNASRICVIGLYSRILL